MDNELLLDAEQYIYLVVRDAINDGVNDDEIDMVAEIAAYDCQKLADWAGIYGEEQGVIRDRFLERGND